MGWTLPSTGMWRGEIFAICDCLVIIVRRGLNNSLCINGGGPGGGLGGGGGPGGGLGGGGGERCVLFNSTAIVVMS